MHVTFSIEPFVLAAEEAKACSCQGPAQSLLYHLQAGDPEAALNLLEEMETATPGMLQHCRLHFSGYGIWRFPNCNSETSEAEFVGEASSALASNLECCMVLPCSLTMDA